MRIPRLSKSDNHLPITRITFVAGAYASLALLACYQNFTPLQFSTKQQRMPCYFWYHKATLLSVRTKDAINAALEMWIHNVSIVTSWHTLNSACKPLTYLSPTISR